MSGDRPFGPPPTRAGITAGGVVTNSIYVGSLVWILVCLASVFVVGLPAAVGVLAGDTYVDLVE